MDKLTKNKLKSLIKDPNWDAVYILKSKMEDSWNKGEVKVDDEFNTFWNLALREGKKAGLEEFINTWEKLALDND